MRAVQTAIAVAVVVMCAPAVAAAAVIPLLQDVAAATDENTLKDMWPAADDDVRAAIRQRVDQLRGGDAA